MYMNFCWFDTQVLSVVHEFFLYFYIGYVVPFYHSDFFLSRHFTLQAMPYITSFSISILHY